MNRPWLRWLGAAAAGAAVGLSFQPYAVWPLAFVGVAGLTLAVRESGGRLRARRSFGVGYVFGLAMLGVAVSWLHVLGIWIALALMIFEALFFGLLGIALALLTRVRWWPLAGALAWVSCEFGYSRVPFGGFGWTRIAYSQVDGPLAGLFPFVGVVGVSLGTAGVGQLLAWLTLRVRNARRHGHALTGLLRLRPVVASAVALALVALGGGLLRTWSGPGPRAGAGAVEVGIVQGNVPGRGIEAMGRARTVTDNHLSETIAMITKARLGGSALPDFVLWPENSTDIDPTLDRTTQEVVQSATRIAGLPILVGAVMEGPGPDQRQTSALWWDPDRGILARYDKRNLVPFGEWIPFRDQLLPLLPILKQVGAQSVPGTTPGVLRVPVVVDGRSQTIAIGDVICFELAYDRTVYEAITDGAQVLTVQSNNATYGGTGQIEQQFAITRARAMESRREIAVATTNSVSGLIDRTGHVTVRTQEFTAASAVVSMPLRSALTPALSIAPWLDRALALATAGWLVAAAVILRRRGSPRAAARPMSQDGENYPVPGGSSRPDDTPSRRQPVP
ncbi:MAG: apolipoprotein N-acyltransferase [Propionibacteriaceae bacterium]